MDKYKDKAFWRAVLMRALKTFGQTLLATGSIAGVTTLAEIKAIDWPYVLVASVLAAVLSVINNLVASIPEYPDVITELPAEWYDPEEDELYEEWRANKDEDTDIKPEV